MIDRSISVTTVTAGLGWVVGFGLIILGAFTNLAVSGVGLWISGVGGVLTMRRWFCETRAAERNAFQAGRDYEANRLHSV